MGNGEQACDIIGGVITCCNLGGGRCSNGCGWCCVVEIESAVVCTCFDATCLLSLPISCQ
jgi:hypothetical protein